MKIYGFYHIACMNNWKSVVDDQIETLSKVNVNKLFISVIFKDENDLTYIKSKLKDNWIIIKSSDNFKDYEFEILKYMRELSIHEEFLCFYLHTKGVSVESTKNFYPIPNGVPHLLKCVEAWRKYMEYFLFNDVNNIINLLKEFDAVGVALIGIPTRHFSGNFWWSKSEYIKTLSKDFGNRWTAEFWIGKNSTGNLKSLCGIQSSYTRIIKEEEYIK